MRRYTAGNAKFIEGVTDKVLVFSQEDIAKCIVGFRRPAYACIISL